MPGIVGIISQKPAAECKRLVDTMVDSMADQSFLVRGTYAEPEMGVYGGWVAHKGSLLPSRSSQTSEATSRSCFPANASPIPGRQAMYLI